MPFFCFDKTEEVYWYNNFRDVTSRISYVFISIEKCVDKPWCETDPAKIADFWTDLEFMPTTFHERINFKKRNGRPTNVKNNLYQIRAMKPN